MADDATLARPPDEPQKAAEREFLVEQLLLALRNSNMERDRFRAALEAERLRATRLQAQAGIFGEFFGQGPHVPPNVARFATLLLVLTLVFYGLFERGPDAPTFDVAVDTLIPLFMLAVGFMIGSNR